MFKPIAPVLPWLLLTLAFLPAAAHAHFGPHPEGMSHWMAHAWPALLALVVGVCFVVWRVVKRKR